MNFLEMDKNPVWPGLFDLPLVRWITGGRTGQRVLPTAAAH